jgi:four helix bundle protein
MAKGFRYQDLEAWKQGMDLVERCYRATSAFPAAELYGITSQLRRAAVSIPTNIAEGHCRRTTGAYLNHLSIAIGSHGELETCLEIAKRLGFLSKRESVALTPPTDSVGRLLNGLHRAIELKAATQSSRPRFQPSASGL